MNRIAMPAALAAFLATVTTLSPLVAQTDVNSAAQLQTAINNGDSNIVITGNITTTTPIYIGTTSSPTLAINGGGFSLSGSSEIFFVQSGNVTLSNATLSGTAIGGSGGTGQLGGGGSLGAGGAIYVGSSATVTASAINFTNNSATGGNGGTQQNFQSGAGGGGGMNGGNGGNANADAGGGGGGNGGSGGVGFSSGGGGGGLQSNGGDGSAVKGGDGGGPNGGAGVFSSGGGNSIGSPASGPNSGGGGGGANASGSSDGGAGTVNGGGGGGGGGTTSSVGGAGGDYAGGGAGGAGGGDGGAGGFGGGGGASQGPGSGGAGGFGAGGGAGGNGSGLGGQGGVGASPGNIGIVGSGGGGAGFGGAIFVQSGGTLILNGNQTFQGNTVTAGLGGGGNGANGAAAGGDLFIMAGAATTIAPGAGNTVTFNETIADDSSNSVVTGQSFTPGSSDGGALTIGSGATPGGTVALNADNTFSDGTIITNHATVQVGNAGALGAGPVINSVGTLTVGNGNHVINASSLTQDAQGNLVLTVNGQGNAAQADAVHVTNTAAVSGTLTVNLGTFSAPAGSHGQHFDFTLLDANAVTGVFTHLDAVDLASGLTASLDYTADSVILDISQQAAQAGAFAAAGLSPNQQGVLQPLNRAAAAGAAGASFTRLTNALTPVSTDAAEFGRVLDQLSPLKFSHFTSTTANNNEAFEVQAMDSYLAGQRSGPHGTFTAGNGQLDASGLTLNDPNYDPGLRMIHSRMLAWNQPASVMSDVPGAMLGGMEMKSDAKDMKSCPSCVADNPWNVFVRGSIILAQGFSQADQPHFNDNSESVVLGADYRFSPHFLVGLTAGYAHTDATLDNANSSATVDSYSPGLYASYTDGGWYGNLIGRYSYNTYTEQRAISFLSQSASGATSGNEGSVDLDGGYDFHAGHWTFGPVAGVQYTHLTVNGFSEAGSDANLTLNEDQSDSLRSRAGGSVRFDFHSGGVQFTPHLTASWQHEFMDQSRGITSQFTNFNGGSFTVRTQDPSTESALIDAGLDARINAAVMIFGDYTAQAGQADYFGQSVQAGVRVNF